MGQVRKLSTQVKVMQKLITTESETIPVLLVVIQSPFANFANCCFYVYYALQILKYTLCRKKTSPSTSCCQNQWATNYSSLFYYVSGVLYTVSMAIEMSEATFLCTFYGGLWTQKETNSRKSSISAVLKALIRIWNQSRQNFKNRKLDVVYTPP